MEQKTKRTKNHCFVFKNDIILFLFNLVAEFLSQKESKVQFQGSETPCKLNILQILTKFLRMWFFFPQWHNYETGKLKKGNWRNLLVFVINEGNDWKQHLYDKKKECNVRPLVFLILHVLYINNVLRTLFGFFKSDLFKNNENKCVCTFW